MGGPFPTASSLPPDGGHSGLLGQGFCRKVPPSQVKCQRSSRSSPGPPGTFPWPPGPHIPPLDSTSCSPWSPQTILKWEVLLGLTFSGTRTAPLESGPGVSPLTWEQAHSLHSGRGAMDQGQHRKLTFPHTHTPTPPSDHPGVDGSEVGMARTGRRPRKGPRLCTCPNDHPAAKPGVGTLGPVGPMSQASPGPLSSHIRQQGDQLVPGYT